KRRKTVVVSFAEHEADILANLLRNLVELLYDGMPPRTTDASDPLDALLLDSDGPTSPPEDVVLQRLLPDAYNEDDMASAEFRRVPRGGPAGGEAPRREGGPARAGGARRRGDRARTGGAAVLAPGAERSPARHRPPPRHQGRGRLQLLGEASGRRPSPPDV